MEDITQDIVIVTSPSRRGRYAIYSNKRLKAVLVYEHESRQSGEALFGVGMLLEKTLGHFGIRLRHVIAQAEPLFITEEEFPPALPDIWNPDHEGELLF